MSGSCRSSEALWKNVHLPAARLRTRHEGNMKLLLMQRALSVKLLRPAPTAVKILGLSQLWWFGAHQRTGKAATTNPEKEMR